MMPDGNTAALNAEEIRQTRADRAWQRWHDEAVKCVRKDWWRKLNMDSVLDELGSLSVTEQEEFLMPLRQGIMTDDTILVIQRALGRACAAFLDSERGCQAITEKVSQLEEES